LAAPVARTIRTLADVGLEVRVIWLRIMAPKPAFHASQIALHAHPHERERGRREAENITTTRVGFFHGFSTNAVARFVIRSARCRNFDDAETL